MIASLVQHAVRATDAAVARAYLAVFRERNALLPFLFHSLFSDESEIAQNVVDPLDRTTVAQFRQLVKYYIDHGYRFVSPDDLLAGLDPAGRYAMLTFDDGYYNNTLALPVLEEFGVPALFFISTNHVRDGKCFWWDVLYRERIAQGATEAQIYGEALAMKGKRTDQIEAELIARFGANVLKPRGDIDRAFTPEELREFSKHPQVHLGNHTADHAILTNYSAVEARAQIDMAQAWLREVIGVTPLAIAYPNGAHNRGIVDASRQAGLQLGFTVRPGKTALPLGRGASNKMMRLSRFVPHAHAPVATQCRTYRSDVLLYGAARSIYLKLSRGQAGQ